jgi:hypothetical protein
VKATYRITTGPAIFWTAGYVALLLFAVIEVLPRWILLPSDSFEFWFLGFWCLAVAWGWYGYLTTPFELRIANGRIFFRSWLRRRQIEASAITVTKSPFFWHVIRIRFTGGTLVVPAQIEGLYEFLSRLKKLNPTVEIQGL